jgi:hypothetical protein
VFGHAAAFVRQQERAINSVEECQLDQLAVTLIRNGEHTMADRSPFRPSDSSIAEVSAVASDSAACFDIITGPLDYFVPTGMKTVIKGDAA